MKMLHFRKLNENDDIDMVASWIYSTDRFLFDLLFDNDRIRATTGIARLINSSYVNPYHRKFITVIYDEDSPIKGVCVGFKGSEISLRETFKAMRDTTCTNLPRIVQNAVLSEIFASKIRSKDYYIGNLYVDPLYRGESLGTKLVEKSKQIASQSNCDAVLLDVEYDKPYLLDFYKKLGFKRDSKNYHRLLGRTYGCYGLKFDLQNLKDGQIN